MEKHNKLLHSLLIAVLIWLGAGCSDDMLQVDNKTILLAENSFKTGNDVNASVIGLYSLLQTVSQQVVLYNEVRADLVQTSLTADADLLQLANGETGTENRYLKLRDFYKVIASCNDILSKMEGVLSLDPAFTETIYKQYRAEVIGVRSWTFFQISKIFGKVSYYTNAIISTEDKSQTTELTAKETVLKVIDDLSPVMNDFILSYSSSVSVDWRVARFNNYAAKMLYAELLMYKGAFSATDLQASYKLASDQLWLVMSEDAGNTSQQKYKVGSSYEKSSWVNIFTSLSTSYNEVIWAIDFSKTNEQTHQLHALFFTNPQLLVASAALNYFASTDSRTTASILDSKVRKFSVNKTTFEADAPIVLYRAADLHLLYAEAINCLGDPDLAVKIINTGYAQSVMTTTGEKLYNAQSKGVRTRAGLTALVLGTTDKQKQADGYIRDERIRELAFEGKRWESLVRYAILDGKNTITVRGQSFPTGKWYAPSN
jgi:starch-binding outer membrane protein, SusD/RagB family